MKRIVLISIFLLSGALVFGQTSDPKWAMGGWYAKEDPDIAFLISENYDGEIRVAVQYHELSCPGMMGQYQGSAISAQLFTKDGKNNAYVFAILKKEDLIDQKVMTIRLDGKTYQFVQTK